MSPFNIYSQYHLFYPVHYLISKGILEHPWCVQITLLYVQYVPTLWLLINAILKQYLTLHPFQSMTKMWWFWYVWYVTVWLILVEPIYDIVLYTQQLSAHFGDIFFIRIWRKNKAGNCTRHTKDFNKFNMYYRTQCKSIRVQIFPLDCCPTFYFHMRNFYMRNVLLWLCEVIWDWE